VPFVLRAWHAAPLDGEPQEPEPRALGTAGDPAVQAHGRSLRAGRRRRSRSPRTRAHARSGTNSSLITAAGCRSPPRMATSTAAPTHGRLGGCHTFPKSPTRRCAGTPQHGPARDTRGEMTLNVRIARAAYIHESQLSRKGTAISGPTSRSACSASRPPPARPGPVPRGSRPNPRSRSGPQAPVPVANRAVRRSR